MRRADRADIESSEFLQGLLHRGAVFAHDAGVVAAHLVPVAVGIDLRIGDAAVEGTERAESVAREEYPFLGQPRNHRLGPVDHRDEVEREALAAAQIEPVTLLDFKHAGADAVVAADHLDRLGVADDLQFGVAQAERGDRRGVVGLHVVYDEIVDPAVADRLADVFVEAASERLLDGVDQGDLLADDQIGVVRYPAGKRPESLEAGRGAIVYADVVNAGQNFRNSHIVIVLFRNDAANLRKKSTVQRLLVGGVCRAGKSHHFRTKKSRIPRNPALDGVRSYDQLFGTNTSAF